MCFDVAVIGAGVIGALTARELAKYKLNIALLEATNDVAMGASKANSGIVHAGFDAKPGTLKAKLNVKGCSMMPAVCADLSVPYKNNGSLVVAFSEEEMETVKNLYDRGIANGVPGMKILDKKALKELEPNLSDEVCGALDAPSAGIVCPYELTIAATENAVVNGVEFKRNCKVEAISFSDGVFSLKTTLGEIKAKYIVDAAGAYSDEIAKMIGDNSVELVMRRGEYFILDKAVGNMVSHTIFQCPSKMGKGILVSPTVDGNLLIGPTAEDIDEKDNTSTTANGLNTVKTFSVKSCPAVSTRNAITSFTGLRAHP
ncbi:MAG: NAD(P)/FAD-dependent oxidoreductase, partial [Clostridia bacterium]|nr:NAD(P)/FAD-dependent oxidoreductase [Clostridia bacterium]